MLCSQEANSRQHLAMPADLVPDQLDAVANENACSELFVLLKMSDSRLQGQS